MRPREQARGRGRAIATGTFGSRPPCRRSGRSRAAGSPDRPEPTGIPAADPVARVGAADAIALAGLSVRLVPPEEAARRLAQHDDAKGRRDGAAGARSEAGARRDFAPAAAKPAIDIDMIVERVQRELKRREQFERERKGRF